MRAWTRLRAYAGLWALVAMLGAGVVFVSSAAGPASRYNDDRALRAAVANAPTATRDITVFERAAAQPITAEGMHGDVASLLEPPLRGMVGASWGVQRSAILLPGHSYPRQFVTLAGAGVSSEPAGYWPLAQLMGMTGLEAAVRMVEGRAPATDPEGTAIEVMASVAVAEALGLRIGQTYHLLLGLAAVPPAPADAPLPEALAVELTGVYEATDPAAPVWQLGPLLAPGQRDWPVSDLSAPVRVGGLVTDQAAVTNLLEHRLDEYFGFQNVGLFRLDEARLSVDWLAPGRAAVVSLPVNPELRQTMRVQTGLAGLIDEFEQQAAAAQAVTAVVAAGIIGILSGLLVLAARLSVERRRGEVLLLLARGGSLAAVVGRFVRESLFVVLPAAAIGWAVHLLLPASGRSLLSGLGAAALVAAAVALLAVPSAVAADQLSRRKAAPARERQEWIGRRSGPARLSVELAVVALAVLGVLLLHQRGLRVGVGVDPYLSAVPVLVGLAAGVVALRLYQWPLRLLAMAAARRRAPVAFLGLARVGRAAPATALPVLVLVLVVAVGGFAAAVRSSVATAHDASALRTVGADVRIIADGLPADAATIAARLDGVEAAAALSRQGFLRVGGGVDQNTVVISVDAPAYQRILAAVAAAEQLPPQLVEARPGDDPIPVLTSLAIDREVSVDIGREYRAVVVGDVAGLPQLSASRSWVLVPRQALIEPPAVQQVLVAGPAANPDSIAAALGVEPTEAEVTTLAQRRAEWAESGFNRGLTAVLAAAVATAVLGGLLAVGLSLVVPAAARGRTLSLLRTMGLSTGQGRRLLLVELLPVTAMAVVVGAATGVAMPVVLAPALGLDQFTAGAPVPLVISPGVVAMLGGLLVLFVVGGTAAEAAVNRRLGLGQVLRVE